MNLCGQFNWTLGSNCGSIGACSMNTLESHSQLCPRETLGTSLSFELFGFWLSDSTLQNCGTPSRLVDAAQIAKVVMGATRVSGDC